jgi:hypothetical protein
MGKEKESEFFNKYQSERERENERVFPFEFCSLLRRRANDIKEKETQTRTDDGVAALLLALLPFRERVLFSLLVSSSIFFVPARAKGVHTHTHKRRTRKWSQSEGLKTLLSSKNKNVWLFRV